MTEWPNAIDPPEDEEAVYNPDEETPDYFSIFDAPDFTSYIKHKSSARAKETEKKVNSMVKAGITFCLSKDNLPDAAALFEYGPRFAQAAGDLTDVSETAYKLIEYTTAPNSPALIFGSAAMSLIGQLYRNHELQAQRVQAGIRQTRAERKAAKLRGEKPVRQAGRPVTIRLFRRSITFNVRFRFRPLTMAGQIVKSQTRQPAYLVDRVFGNKKLRMELEKQGFGIRARGE